MKTDLYSFVGIFSKCLDTLARVLEKAAAMGAPEAEMLGWRLADDMFPLGRQAQVVCDFAKQWPARAAGLAVPPALTGEPTLAQLKTDIAQAKAYLADLKPEQFEGRDGVPITMNLGQIEPTLPTAQWMAGFALSNIYFHLTIAYAIARSKGVPLGKVDLFAGGL